MKTILLTLFVSAIAQTNAQGTLQSIGFNNSSALISDIGVYFNNFNTSTHGYEIPNGSLKNIIYSSTFWYGGQDMNGQLKLAAQDIYSDGSSQDLWPGTLSIGSANAINETGPTIWAVSKAEIENHQLNYQQTGYVIPASISTWPAHGDIVQGASNNLAPFVDTDGNGIYEPNMGDYPCIKGDNAAFIIMNDKKNVHASGSDPIGIEVHLLFYQFETLDDLNNTTFVDVDIFNRGTQTIYDFTNGFAVDGDLGNPFDDFAGCDTNRNLIYYYNDANDEDATGVLGYGAMPPSFGVVCLNQTMTSASVFGGSTTYPTSPAGIYNVMNGLNWNGSTVYDASNNPTKFQYYDNPSNNSGWSELIAGNTPAEKKALLSVNLNTLVPNDHKSLTYAVIFNQGTSNLESVNGLMDVCDSIQAFYDSYDPGCGMNVAGIDENLEVADFSFFPNPTSGLVKINVNNKEGFEVIVRSLDGKEVVSSKTLDSTILLDVNKLESGMYMIQINQNGHISSKQLVKVD